MRNQDINDPEASALTPEELEKVLSSIDIPVCPAIVTQALSEALKDEPDLQRLTKLVTADPSMSAAALKLANSAIYRSGHQLSNARHAVERLGTKAVVCIIVAGALRSSVEGLPAKWLDEFWTHATQVAVIAAIVARYQFGISQDSAYTYALFHNAAIPMMMKRFPGYPDVLAASKTSGEMLVVAEASHFPCTHPIVGSLMIRNWGLPATIGLAIRFHHEADAYELPETSLPGSALALIAVTHVAEYLIASIQAKHDYEVGGALYKKALAFMGISEAELDTLRQDIEDVLNS